jgi:hypothetical protein
VQECAESGEQKRIRVNQSTTLVLITTIYIVHVQLIDPNYGVAHGGAVAQAQARPWCATQSRAEAQGAGDVVVLRPGHEPMPLR